MTKGGEHQSLSDSSIEAWIKFYQQNENSANSQISYYTRGAVVALLLLSELTKHGKHLDDLLKIWWYQWQQTDYKGLNNQNLTKDLQNLCPQVDWHTWLDKQILMPNPNIVAKLTEALASLGLLLTTTEKPSLGCKLAEETNALIVKQVIINSPAHQAGLQVGDEIIAINDWRVRTNTHIEQALETWASKQTKTAINITLNHKGFLQRIVLLPTQETINYQLTLNESAPIWLKNENHHDPK